MLLKMLQMELALDVKALVKDYVMELVIVDVQVVLIVLEQVQMELLEEIVVLHPAQLQIRVKVQ